MQIYCSCFFLKITLPLIIKLQYIYLSKILYYLESWHTNRNPKFPYRKNLPIKSSFIPAMYENFEIIKALITTVSVMHNRPHVVKKFPQNDSNIAIFGFKVPKRILHVSNGVQMLLLITPLYQI